MTILPTNLNPPIKLLIRISAELIQYEAHHCLISVRILVLKM